MTLHRYNPGHGKGGEYMGMEEDAQGHWCAWEDVAALEKAVADYQAGSQAHHERALRETDRCTELEREVKALQTELEHTRQQLRGEEIVAQGYFRERNALETERDQARALLSKAPARDFPEREVDAWWAQRNAFLAHTPAPAAEPFPSTIRKGKEWQARAESAEATLAAVREKWAQLEASRMPPQAIEWFCKGNGTTGDEVVDARIRALLRPSPAADEGGGA